MVIARSIARPTHQNIAEKIRRWSIYQTMLQRNFFKLEFRQVFVGNY